MRLKRKLIRELLLTVERNPAGHPTPIPELADYSEPEVLEHVLLAVESELVEADSPYRYMRRLTWKGHETLRDLRERGLA